MIVGRYGGEELSTDFFCIDARLNIYMSKCFQYLSSNIVLCTALFHKHSPWLANGDIYQVLTQ